MFSVVAKTDTGQKRSVNEDAYYVDPGKGIFIVAYGMGGHKSGARASKLCIAAIMEYLLFVPLEEVDEQHLERAIRISNKVVYEASRAEGVTMGATVVVGIVKRDSFLVAHVGDSRAYYFDGSRLKRLTNDHSNVFRLVIQGKLTEEEGRVHPWSNLINRAIGLEEDVEAEVQSVPYSGETILLCTDGLTDMLPKKEIEKLFLEHSDLNTLCDLLIRKANQVGGKDNITVVLACPGNTGYARNE